MNFAGRPSPPPTTAVVSVALFCGTVATIGGGSWVGEMITESPELQYGINPVLFTLGCALGAMLLRGVFLGKAPSLAAWMLGWAAFWPLVWAVGMFTDRSYQKWGQLFAFVAFLFAAPVGLAFGAILMGLTRALASKLHRSYFASGDPVKVAAESAPWLLGAAAIKWTTQPVSLQGMSAVVAAGAALWLAARGRRSVIATLAGLLMVLALFDKVFYAVRDARETRHQNLPVCWQALESAALRVPGVSKASTATLSQEETELAGESVVVNGVPTKTSGPTATLQKLDLLVYASPDSGSPSALAERVDQALKGVACRDNDADFHTAMTYTVTVEPAACWAAIEPAVRGVIGAMRFNVLMASHERVGAGRDLVETQTLAVKLQPPPDAGSASALSDEVALALKALRCSDDRDPGFKLETKYLVTVE